MNKLITHTCHCASPAKQFHLKGCNALQQQRETVGLTESEGSLPGHIMWAD